MPKWLRISIRVLCGIVAALLLIWVLLLAYVETHKNELLKKLTENLNEQINGEIKIKDIKLSLWKGFPNLAIEMDSVSVRDSLYYKHRHSLMEAQNIYVNLNLSKLVTRRIEILKITASHGSIYLFTDSSGYSNTYLFQKKRTAEPKKSKEKVSFLNFALDDMQFVLEHKIKNKLFRIDLHHFSGKARKEKDGWHTQSTIDARINDFCFNTEKGSYLKGVNLKANLHFNYNPEHKHIEIPDQPLTLNGEQLSLAGNFHFDQSPSLFDLHLHSNTAKFATVRSWLSPNISCKLDSINLLQPFKVDAYINGHMKYRDTPLVAVLWDVKNNVLQTPFDDFSNCSFKGKFINEFAQGKGHNDINSAIQLMGVRAQWTGIPFAIDTFHLVNLTKPNVQFELQSLFPLVALNNAAENIPFEFKNGIMTFRLHYNGTISAITGKDTTIPEIKGFISIRNADFIYLPRNLEIKNTSADLLMDGDNMQISNVSAYNGESSLHMEGTAYHIFRFYFENPEKVTISWHIKSPSINLGDFIGFVGKRKRVMTRARAQYQAQNNTRNKANRILSQLDKVLDLANVTMDVDIDKLTFRHFTANHILAAADLSTQNIVLQKISLLHAGGSIKMDAVIDQSAQGNPFKLNADMDNVDIGRLFYAFEDFGQEAIESKNVKGKISVHASINGNLTEAAKIVPNSLNGKVSYKFIDGAIVNFEPFTNISKFIFKKRDLSNVMFRDLSGDLTIQGKKVIIPPTQIVSSALYLKIEGLYDPPMNTDISLELPLRNPRKDALDENDPNSIIVPKKKGLILYLRAKSDKNGKVKLGLDRNKQINIGKKDFTEAGE